MNCKYNDSYWQKIFIKLQSFLRSRSVLAKLLNFSINIACEAYIHGKLPRFFDRKWKPCRTTKAKQSNFIEIDYQKYDVISFDIFDTLLHRIAGKPESIFEIMEIKYDVNGFPRERIEAEIRAKKQSLGVEISLDEIYKNILPKFQGLKDKELVEEDLNLYVDPIALQFLKKVQSAGKRTIAISDMYIRTDYIQDLLHKRGISFDAIYVSCDINATKADGKLYAYVRQKEGMRTRVAHLGDNLRSDVLAAKRFGFDSYQFVPYSNSRSESLAVAIHEGLVAFRCEFKNLYEKLGYILAGPIALGYANFVSNEVELNKIDKVLFVARDGWILKNVFEYLNHSKSKAEYVYLNRIVGLTALLQWADNPNYLKIILDHYSAAIPGLVVSCNHQENLNSFQRFKKEILLQSLKSRNELVQHVLRAADNAKSVAIVDVTTSSFSSYLFAKEILADRLEDAFYLITYINKKFDYVYEVYQDQPIAIGNTHIVELLELLLSSPEPSILSIHGGAPLFSEPECEKRQYVYHSILNGVMQYVRDFERVFGYNQRLMMSFDQWYKFTDRYISTMTEDDILALNNIKFSSHPDGTTDAHKLFE